MVRVPSGPRADLDDHIDGTGRRGALGGQGKNASPPPVGSWVGPGISTVLSVTLDRKQPHLNHSPTLAGTHEHRMVAVVHTGWPPSSQPRPSRAKRQGGEWHAGGQSRETILSPLQAAPGPYRRKLAIEAAGWRRRLAINRRHHPANFALAVKDSQQHIRPRRISSGFIWPPILQATLPVIARAMSIL